MDNKINKLLDETIEKEIRSLASLENGSEQKSSAVDDLKKLYELKLEKTKIEQAKSESMNREKQAKSQFWVQVGGIAAQVGVGIAGFIAYDIWNRRCLNFETNGVIGSPTTRNLLSRMIPRIKS